MLLPQGVMLVVLEQVEQILPDMLRDGETWESLFINYHPPVVERLWRSWGKYRINLHRIHPCTSSEALFHPHPWPSAMHILSGTYEMAVGYGTSDDPPPYAATLVSQGDLRYEMNDPHGWHYVRPIEGMAMTLMVTGQPWERSTPKNARPLQPLQPLSLFTQQEMLDFFRARFPAV